MASGWNTYGYDTGHSNLNHSVAGPSDLDQEWRWRTKVHNQPVVGNGTICVSCSDRQVTAFRVDGTGKWSYTHPQPAEFSQVDFDNDQVSGMATNPVVGDGAVYHVVNDRCVSLDAADGTERWSTLLPTSTGEPAYDGGVQIDQAGRLYVAYSDRIHTLESDSGSVVWSESRRELHEPPVIDAERNHLLYTNRNFVLRALAADSGRQQWQYPASGDDEVRHCRITADGLVILGGEGRLRALDVETGDPQWTISNEYSRRWFLPHPPSNNVFALTSDGQLEAVDIVTGTARWSVDTGPDEGFPIRATNQHLYLQAGEEIVVRNPRSGALQERCQVGFHVQDFVVLQNGVVVAGKSDTPDDYWLSLLSDRSLAQSTPTDTEVFNSDYGAEAQGDGTQVYDDATGLSYCPDCGADLSETDAPNFCPQCGARL